MTAPTDDLLTELSSHVSKPEHVFDTDRSDLRIVDLRDDDAWADLPEVWEATTRGGQRPIALVGVIGEGVPTEHAAEADRLLSGVIHWPPRSESIEDTLQQAVAVARQTSRNQPLKKQVLETSGERLVTYCPQLRTVFSQLERAASSEFSILLIGETGTGKTTIARLIHQLSTRSDHRFVTVPCGALPDSLVGSELFGHVRGAFTGADRDKDGKFEVARGGTLLLDEVDVLALEQQANLLRVLESGEYEPVGSNETMHSDARIIAAANRCLETAIDEQRFRSDLYFRLNQVKFVIPPLRERRMDIIPLTAHVLEECRTCEGTTVKYIDPEVLTVLKRASWPGNVRQLRNEIRRAAAFCIGGVLTVDALSPDVVAEAKQATTNGRPGNGNDNSSKLATEVAQTECEMIESMLREQNFNRAATARALGISRVTLYNRIRKYDIKVAPKRKTS